MKIGFIGSGKMAGALMESFLEEGLVDAGDLYASDVLTERLRELEEILKLKSHEVAFHNLSNKDILKSCKVVFLCVKPQNVQEVLEEIGNEESEAHLFISIAAGIRIGTLEKALPKARVVRVMPNTPCLVGKGVSGFCLGKNAKEGDREAVKKLLGSFGKCIEVTEDKMDVITALSGSGPGFFALLLKYFAEAGMEHGLEKDEAYLLADYTLYGTGKLLSEKEISSEKLVEMVATKGGTTEAGIAVLDEAGIKETIRKTISAATKRSKELGEENSQ